MFGIISGDFLFYIDNGILSVFIKLPSIIFRFKLVTEKSMYKQNYIPNGSSLAAKAPNETFAASYPVIPSFARFNGSLSMLTFIP